MSILVNAEPQVVFDKFELRIAFDSPRIIPAGNNRGLLPGVIFAPFLPGS